MSDRSEFTELYYGSYEFDVIGKYIYYDIRTPTYVFIIDVSYEAHVNGMFLHVLEALKSTLDSIPNPQNTKICILTVDEFVHFYSFSDEIEKGPKVYTA